MTKTRQRSGARRRGMALFVFIVAAAAAGVVYLIGVLSDWSGRHEVPIQSTAGAIAILIAGILLAAVILRRGDR
jgi:hypothetical protein